MKNAKYIEPDDYIPKDIRKKYKLGEFAERDEIPYDEALEKIHKSKQNDSVTGIEKDGKEGLQ